MAQKKAANKPNLKPLGDRVLVRPVDQEEEKKSASGIIIPQTVKEDKPDRGTVIAVGPGKTDDNGKKVPMSVKTGDTIIFQWGEKITIDDEDYFIVSDSNILATVG